MEQGPGRSVPCCKHEKPEVDIGGSCSVSRQPCGAASASTRVVCITLTCTSMCSSHAEHVMQDTLRCSGSWGETSVTATPFPPAPAATLLAAHHPAQGQALVPEHAPDPDLWSRSRRLRTRARAPLPGAHLHALLELPGADPHEGNLVSVPGIHVGLHGGEERERGAYTPQQTPPLAHNARSWTQGWVTPSLIRECRVRAVHAECVVMLMLITAERQGL